jgi:ADP-heptose:LPS heptosyltransferase
MSRPIAWQRAPLSADVKKILVIKIKYIGDVVLAVPSLRALRARHPQAEIHVLTAEDAAHGLRHLPWLTKVWALPRTRGKLRLADTLPMLRALRREHFDASVDLVGNDRGAYLSRFIGAPRRLGVVVTDAGSPWLAKLMYNELIDDPDTTRHQAVRDYYILQAWDIPPPIDWEAEVRADPALVATAAKWLPGNPALLHVSTSQVKKEWASASWIELGQRLVAAKQPVVFSSGSSPREQKLLEPLRAAGFTCLPPTPGLDLFIAILARPRVFICGDTAPLHLAAGLGVPTIGLFGATSANCWAPQGANHVALQGAPCVCSGHWRSCQQPQPCLQALTPAAVMAKVCCA